MEAAFLSPGSASSAYLRFSQHLGLVAISQRRRLRTVQPEAPEVRSRGLGETVGLRVQRSFLIYPGSQNSYLQTAASPQAELGLRRASQGMGS